MHPIVQKDFRCHSDIELSCNSRCKVIILGGTVRFIIPETFLCNQLPAHHKTRMCQYRPDQHHRLQLFRCSLNLRDQIFFAKHMRPAADQHQLRVLFQICDLFFKPFRSALIVAIHPGDISALHIFERRI